MGRGTNISLPNLKPRLNIFFVAKQQHEAEMLPGRAMTAGGDGDCPGQDLLTEQQLLPLLPTQTCRAT